MLSGYMKYLNEIQKNSINTLFPSRTTLANIVPKFFLIIYTLLVGKTPERPTLSGVLSETAGFREGARLWDAKSYQTH
jgi:hypothetical protein